MLSSISSHIRFRGIEFTGLICCLYVGAALFSLDEDLNYSRHYSLASAVASAVGLANVWSAFVFTIMYWFAFLYAPISILLYLMLSLCQRYTNVSAYCFLPPIFVVHSVYIIFALGTAESPYLWLSWTMMVVFLIYLSESWARSSDAAGGAESGRQGIAQAPGPADRL